MLDGSWKSAQVWGGVREGMIRVDGFGSKVPAAVQTEVLARQKDMAAGQLAVFSGGKVGVKDNEGKTVIVAGRSLDDGAILTMNWLVEGVATKLSR